MSTIHNYRLAQYLILVSMAIWALDRWACAAAGQATEQEPASILQLPQVPDKAPRDILGLPRPQKGPEAVDAFIDNVSRNDAVFEVVVGQGRILTTKMDFLKPAAKEKLAPLIAVGDPSVIDFDVLNTRQIRVTGLRMGVTDLSLTTEDKKNYNLEVRVVADLELLRAQLQQSFPDASVKVTQIRDHLVVEGQARDPAQVTRIVRTIRSYLESSEKVQIPPRPAEGKGQAPPPIASPQTNINTGSGTINTGAGAMETEGRVVNLLRVPGPQQVMLQVRIAELNRTALREIGADLIGNPGDGLLGTQIGGATLGASGIMSPLLAVNPRDVRTFFDTSRNTTMFGIFPSGHFEFLLRVLRRNRILKILAEPNLVAMNGQQANFLAGGQFPVPVPQTSTGGAGTSVTVLFKDFGVLLAFTPHILDHGAIRLSVDPEVSSVDFALGTIIVPGGSPVPGLNIRKAHTTVELREGQTLAMAGLLQVTLDGQAGRIPGIGDLPILGPFFSNTSSERIEKELIVLVTPYLVEAMHPGQVPPLPGAEVNGPNDLEFYLGNRIEGISGRDWRATTQRYTTPVPALLPTFLRLQDEFLQGPYGFSDSADPKGSEQR